ncbi:MAG: Cell division inhibitor, partial [uncultured Cytophagales bacterium]
EQDHSRRGQRLPGFPAGPALRRQSAIHRDPDPRGGLAAGQRAGRAVGRGQPGSVAGPPGGRRPAGEPGGQKRELPLHRGQPAGNSPFAGGGHRGAGPGRGGGQDPAPGVGAVCLGHHLPPRRRLCDGRNRRRDRLRVFGGRVPAVGKDVLGAAGPGYPQGGAPHEHRAGPGRRRLSAAAQPGAARPGRPAGQRPPVRQLDSRGRRGGHRGMGGRQRGGHGCLQLHGARPGAQCHVHGAHPRGVRRARRAARAGLAARTRGRAHRHGNRTGAQEPLGGAGPAAPGGLPVRVSAGRAGGPRPDQHPGL